MHFRRVVVFRARSDVHELILLSASSKCAWERKDAAALFVAPAVVVGVVVLVVVKEEDSIIVRKRFFLDDNTVRVVSVSVVVSDVVVRLPRKQNLRANRRVFGKKMSWII